MPDRYDDKDLRRGSTEQALVERLQRDLLELGFGIIDKVDGVFGRYTYWAVREFQAYAAMPDVAVLASPASAIYADRLGRVSTGADRYTGPVSGVINQQTRKALQTWLDNRWRCPVVAEAWEMAGASRKTLVAENIWRHDHVASTKPRMFVVDLSGHFGAVEGFAIGDRMPLGDFVTYLSWEGPRSVPPQHTIPSGEVLPEGLVGVALGDMNPAQRSTFKVVRATSEVECIGFFDSVNAYDNAFVSVGPCHWTLGIVSPGGNVSEGELCGYLAYLRHREPVAHQVLLGHFGVDTDEKWVDAAGQPTGRSLFESSSRKYAGWVALCDDTGVPRRLVEREEEGDFFKTWHWFYRFVAAGRGVQGYRRAMWDMARMRLRDIRAARMDAVTIGDIFTSERAMAILQRWHIRFPGHIVSGGRAGPQLTAGLSRAKAQAAALNWSQPPAGWGQPHEDALLAALREGAANAGGGLADSIAYVDTWPSWATGTNPRKYKLSPSVGRLSTGRGSFVFEGAGLPPPPY